MDMKNTLPDLPFERTLEALKRIWYNDGEKKHGDAWLTRADHLDMVKAQRHALMDRDEQTSAFDADSGELHSEHEIVRLMCRNERRRIAMERKDVD